MHQEVVKTNNQNMLNFLATYCLFPVKDGVHAADFSGYAEEFSVNNRDIARSKAGETFLRLCIHDPNVLMRCLEALSQALEGKFTATHPEDVKIVCKMFDDLFKTNSTICDNLDTAFNGPYMKDTLKEHGVEEMLVTLMKAYKDAVANHGTHQVSDDPADPADASDDKKTNSI